MEIITREFERLKNNTSSEKCKILRNFLLNGFFDGLKSVDPEELVSNFFKIKETLNNDSKKAEKNDILPEVLISGINLVNNEKIKIKLSEYEEVLIIGGGKATAPMANALIKILGRFLECKGLINIPYGQEWGNSIKFQFKDLNSSIQVNYASHPIPDESGMNGTKNMVELVKNSDKSTLIFILISGGGSALMPFPGNGLQLNDLQKVNDLLLKSGADINEINTVRKHLSSFKGGNLVKHIYPHEAISLIISDVIGDPLDVIASGPTVPDKSTFKDAESVLKKYNLLEDTLERDLESVPEGMLERLRLYIMKGVNGQISENPKNSDPIFEKITNIVIGSAEIAKKEIEKSFRDKGIKSILDYPDKELSKSKMKELSSIMSIMKGEARDFGAKLAQFLRNLDRMQDKSNIKKKENKENKLYYLINSGEFTVTIKGTGTGGRNQEMLLSVLCNLHNYSLKNIDFAIISMAFDGIEGNSPAAGALIDSNSVQKMRNLGINPETNLNNNNSFVFFEKLEDSIKIGQTKTNINDISAILIKFP